MRIRYFLEYALELDQADGHHYYRPIGVWARGEGPWDLTILYLPDAEMRWFETQLFICSFMERGDTHFPDDLLESWIAGVSRYAGDCSPIYETVERSAEAVAMTVFAMLQQQRPLDDPPLPGRE